jgi:hypothetical protein
MMSITSGEYLSSKPPKAMENEHKIKIEQAKLQGQIENEVESFQRLIKMKEQVLKELEGEIRQRERVN